MMEISSGETVFVALVLSCLCVRFLHKPRGKTAVAGSQPITSTFLSFQRQYLLVYLLCVLGDWLQGPSLYALYVYYDLPVDSIALLYTVDSLSSMLLGFGGTILADRWGRRLLSVACTVIYMLSSALKLTRVFPALLLSAVFAGAANALLSVTFESWMVSEHEKRRFQNDWLSGTFSLSALGEGIMAVVAGMMAYGSERIHRRWVENGTASEGLSPHIWPFVMASLLFPLVGLLIQRTWRENFGISRHRATGHVLVEAWKTLRSAQVILLGCSQACFQAGIYVFVFVWTPLIERQHAAAQWPPPKLGLMFGCLMVATMLGTTMFEVLTRRWSICETVVVTKAYFGALLAIVVMTFAALWSPSTEWRGTGTAITVLAFLLFEFSYGLYMPCAGILRTRHIPDHMHASTMGVFQLALNAMVMFALWYSTAESEERDDGGDEDGQPSRVLSTLLTMCMMLLIGALVFHRLLQTHARDKQVNM